MWDNLFNHVNIKRENVHIPQGHFDGPGNAISRDYESEEPVRVFCESYENAIKAAGGVDIQVLGIGTNGHVAFNEPGSSLSSRTRVEQLSRSTIADNARFFGGDMTLVPTQCVTMGVGTLMESKELVLLAKGKAKVAAIKGCVEGPVSGACPASILQMHPQAFVLLDEDAASGLSPALREAARQTPGPLPRYIRK